MEFKKCPQSFLFQYLYGLKQPTTPVLAKGTMCHSALESIFDLEPDDRTIEHLQNLFRSHWSRRRGDDGYKEFFLTEQGERDLQAEGNWGREGLQLLENYYRVEDPRQIIRPNPVQREIWVRAKLSVQPQQGVTGYVRPSNTPNLEASEDESFLVRGIVDRLDMIQVDKHTVALRIVDYKTGKAPMLKYNAPTNQRIMEESFYQLQIYALLMRESYANGLPIRFLRLFHLTSDAGAAQKLDMDLGATQVERDEKLQALHQDLSQTWMSIVDLVSKQDPTAFVGCNRSFCYCHVCRPRFVPGTVWEPDDQEKLADAS